MKHRLFCTLTLGCFLVIPYAVSGDTNTQKLQDIQKAQGYELQSLTQGAFNTIKVQGGTPRAAAKFLPTDMDDDGMADTWETANGLDPSDPNDAWLDPDNDQVVNLFEYQLGSDIFNTATPAVITVGATGALFTDVKAAIDSVTAAVPGKVIRIAGGTYPVTYNTSSSKVVMVQGGWSPDFSTRDLSLYPTTFDGELAAEIIYFSVSSDHPVMVLDGINFVNGKGSFGAVNLLATGSAFMRTSVFNCSISGSETTYALGAVLSMMNWGTSESDRTIANTVIGGNGGHGCRAQITGDTTARWRIINTTISNNKNTGSNGKGIDVFTLNNGVLNAHVYNSIIWGNDQDALDIRRNITFNVDHSNINNVSASLGAIYRPGMGVLNEDPLYFDPTSGNYHLQDSSPMVDAGINTGVPLIDFEGEPRLVGSLVDIGADEVATLANDNSPTSESPTAGTWSGNSVAFNVSGDKSKITSEGSKLLDSGKKPIALIIGPLKGSGECKDFNITVWYKTNIPIVDGNFKYSSMQELTINGTFTTQTTSEGQLSAEYKGQACSGKYKKSGSWQARASSSAKRMASSSAKRMLSTDAIMSPNDRVSYKFNENGNLIGIQVERQIGAIN